MESIFANSGRRIGNTDVACSADTQEWLDAAQDGIEDERADMLSTDPYVGEERRDRIWSALSRRIELPGKHVERGNSVFALKATLYC
ncbi:MAG: hypothetical protein LBU32_04350 [Clostridiales bacterium]|nr:hypothetical protein [Clostridiales bacterium]